MKTGIGQSKYRNLTLFHVVWSVPVEVFLTVTFSILSFFDWSRSFGILRWARLFVHGFCSGFFTLTKHNTKELHVWRRYQTNFIREHLPKIVSGDFCTAPLFQVSIHVHPCHPLPQTTGNTSFSLSMVLNKKTGHGEFNIFSNSIDAK